MPIDSMPTDPILPPTADPNATDSDLDHSWRGRVERLISGIPQLTRMVADIHRELMGEMGTDRPGLRGDVRELKREVVAQRAEIDRHDREIQELKVAPGNEARQEIHRRHDRRSNLGLYAAVAVVSGSVAAVWQLVTAAFKAIFHH